MNDNDSRIHDVEVLDNPRLIGHYDATILYARLIEPKPVINKWHIVFMIYSLIFLSGGLLFILEAVLK